MGQYPDGPRQRRLAARIKSWGREFRLPGSDIKKRFDTIPHPHVASDAVRLPRSLDRDWVKSSHGGPPSPVYPDNRTCIASAMSALCLVSRVTPVHTAMRNCTGDEG